MLILAALALWVGSAQETVDGGFFYAIEDVDGDGPLDLVVHVQTQALELNETDEEAVLARLGGFDPLDNFFRVVSSEFPRRGEPEMGQYGL